MTCYYRDLPQATSIYRDVALSIHDGQQEDLRRSSKPFHNDRSGEYEQCHRECDGHGPSFHLHCLRHWHLSPFFGWILHFCGSSWSNTGNLNFMIHKLN
jgi:hypothetical protein